MRSEADVGGQPRRTPDDDARHVYHNLSIAIDPARQLFNGNATVLASWIDALGPRSGMQVLHIGCGLGYYTAIIADCIGPTGRVVAIEVDGALASEAVAKLASVLMRGPFPTINRLRRECARTVIVMLAPRRRLLSFDGLSLPS